MLALHDTALGKVVALDLREPGKLSMYVCGPTVYDVPHIGHGRFALAFDVLRRYLEWCGIDVVHVLNVTDIDDRIIKRADEEGRAASEVARHYEAAWFEQMDRLGVLRPTVTPHATEYVQKMILLIGELFSAGYAYELDDGVYLEVARISDYGLLARQPLGSLRAGARVEVGESKRSPLDFALWKKAKPGEPEWASPWGGGRPGWHTECVVMSLDLLGEGFDLHGGAQDLVFPHHENERAQAVALGKRFARHWVHNGFVEVGGEKMAKSLENYTSLADLLDRADPRAYRLLVLRSHYRRPLEVTPVSLADAEEGLARLDSLARRMWPDGREAGGQEIDPGAVERFKASMDDDLDTPAATALIFELVRSANAASDEGDRQTAERLATTVVQLAGALGLTIRGEREEIDERSAQLVSRRDRARRNRDFQAADAIRDELTQMGWRVEDTPEGTKIHRDRRSPG